MTRPPESTPSHDPSAMAALLDPHAIVILGASGDANRLSGRTLGYLLRDGFTGSIYPINPKYREIAGIPCYESLDALPGPADLAVVALPAKASVAAMADLARHGIKAAIVFASGFAEMGPVGAELERQLRDTARSNGIALLGPNCLGTINAFSGAVTAFSQYAKDPVLAGPVAFVTQSGAFGTAIASTARRRALGLGYFINTGNEAVIDSIDLLGAVIEDARIQVAAAYLEGLKSGPRLRALAARAAQLGKPLIVVKVGRTSAGARASASHTGSLAGEDALFQGLVNQSGIIRATDDVHLLDMAELYLRVGLPEGPGIAIVTQSGGAGVLMADRAEELGLKVPVPGEAAAHRLREALPAFGAAGNPIDVTAQFVSEPEILIDSVEAVLADPDIHVAVIWLQQMHEFAGPLVDILTGLKAAQRKPIVVCWINGPEDAIQTLSAAGVAVLPNGIRAIEALAGLAGHAAWRKTGRRPMPAPADAAPPLPPGPVPSLRARELLCEAGIAVVETVLASDLDAALDAAQRLGYPVALKIESPDLPHKSDAGGVVLDIADADALRAAHGRILDRVRRDAPSARIDGMLVQPMTVPGVELVIGLRNDPLFGMVVMVGLGGLFVEILKDVSFRCAPVDRSEALAMLDELKAGAILDGPRGRPAVDRDALATVIERVSRFGAAHAGDLAELDLNPLFARNDSVVAVDWLMLGHSPGDQ